MGDERVVKANAVRVFLRDDGILIDFGQGAPASDGSGDVVDSVSKVVVEPAAFRRMGMALHEAIRKLPREQRLASPPAPTSSGIAAPSPSETAGGSATPKSGPRISFIGSGAPGPRSAAADRPPTDGTKTGRGASPGKASSRTSPPGKPPLQDLLEPTRDLPSSRAPVPTTKEHAKRLLDHVAALGAPYVNERSFRMREGELLSNRFLLSVGRPDDGSASDEALTRLFRVIGLPAPFLDEARGDLPRAHCVHLGFEGDGESPLLKVYLEVGGEGRAEQQPEPSGAGVDDAEPVLEHVAYKWDPTEADSGVVGRYWWYPHLSSDAIRRRVDGIYGDATPQSRQIAHGVIELAAGRMPERDIHYLEIEEEGNPRRSYSINFYDAGLKVRDLHPLLTRMRRLFDIAPGHFQALYDQIKTRRFGHLAGGVHRNGKDFFNVYYGPQLFNTGVPPGPWRDSLLRGAEDDER